MLFSLPPVFPIDVLNNVASKAVLVSRENISNEEQVSQLLFSFNLSLLSNLNFSAIYRAELVTLVIVPKAMEAKAIDDGQIHPHAYTEKAVFNYPSELEPVSQVNDILNNFSNPTLDCNIY
ncbi:unnamed protein product [Protopolystoma xenopodis]|uniref:Uncharacterized protein n=1 Tax=Protopolystoma xenopodis TaxID=117903 RepID=A0A448WC08_9PLAT|nr:unnamed protein product [Protopolystoma xenopodis]